MEGFSIISHNIILLACMIGIGALAVGTGYLSVDMKNMLSKFIVKITLPLMIISSLTQVEPDAARIKNSLFVIAAALIVIGVLYLIGTAVTKLLHFPPETALIHRCLTAFGNVSFIGYPIVQSLYGDSGLFYAALYAFINDILVWTLVVWRLSALGGGKKPTCSETLKNCFSPPTAAFLISFILLIFKLRPTGILYEITNGIGGTTIYLSMIFIGGTLAEVNFIKILKSAPILFVVSFKMILMPVFLIFVMRHIPMDPLVEGVIIMQTAVPSQTIISILSKEYGGNTEYVVKGIFITTLAGLLTMPFIYYLLSNWKM